MEHSWQDDNSVPALDRSATARHTASSPLPRDVLGYRRERQTNYNNRTQVCPKVQDVVILINTYDPPPCHPRSVRIYLSPVGARKVNENHRRYRVTDYISRCERS